MRMVLKNHNDYLRTELTLATLGTYSKHSNEVRRRPNSLDTRANGPDSANTLTKYPRERANYVEKHADNHTDYQDTHEDCLAS